MKRGLSGIGLLVAVVVAGSLMAGATVISLAGSDSRPFEERYTGVCYSNVVVEAPITAGDKGKDFKVRQVIVSGNFQGCAGYTMLLTAYLNPGRNTYAFHKLQPGETSFSLSFIPGQSEGQWHKDYPTVEDGQLIPQGPLTPPPNELPIENISWVISDSWR